MSSVFISYAHEDEQRIRPLVHALEQSGLEVFWDRTIPPGKKWRDVITEALETAGCVLVAWSKHSVTASFIAEEAEEGKKRGILVPVLLDPLDLPPESPMKLPLGFRDYHAADLTGFQGGTRSLELETLVKAIDSVVRTSSERRSAGQTNRQAREQKIQIGEVAFPKEHPGARRFYDVQERGLREISVPVKFDFSFTGPPKIIVSLRKIDLGDSKARIHRISVSAQNVGRDGFDLYFQTWEDSQIYDAVATWTAVGE